MGFLDNLEDSLKSLESQEERNPAAEKRRGEEQARARAAAPWAEQLKSSPFTQELFEKAALTGHRLRTKIYMSWLEATLRLEARGRRLDLEPTPDGIVAHFIEPDGETSRKNVDLNGNPEDLLRSWL